MRDFFKSNLALLNKKSPKTYSLLKNATNESQYKISTSKSGIPTLSTIGPDGTNRALHSKYDPIQEATRFIDTCLSRESSNYILIGLGLGYHLNELLKKLSSNARIIVIEKNPSLARLAFTHSDFSSVINHPGISFHIGVDPNSFEEILYNDRTNLAIHGYIPIDFKPLIELEKSYYTLIKREIEQVYQRFRMDISTQAAFSQKFYTNIFNNGQAIIKSPGILALKDIFSKVPAIMVSAGPSLDKNIGLIKSARDRILVITVATALKPLLKNSIKPDFVVAVDPNEDTLQSFNIETIPENLWLIYDPCIPSAVSSLFNGRSIMIDSKIELAKWLADHSDRKGSLGNIFSVAHSAFYLARYMGCKPIILVGQDLSFEGHRMHCTGSFYNQANQDNIGADRTLDVLEYNKYREYTPSMTPTLDIFDNYSNTTKAMETYKYQFKNEMDLNFSTLNATEGGVDIPGAENISLREALNKHCQEIKSPILNNFEEKIKPPNKNNRLSVSIKKQKEKFDKIGQILKKIENDYLTVDKNSIDIKQFVLEMENLYANLLKDTTTITLMQGHDYLGFVEWNQKTRRIDDAANISSVNDIIQKKFLRDRDFLNTLSKTVNLLSDGFEKWGDLGN